VRAAARVCTRARTSARDLASGVVVRATFRELRLNEPAGAAAAGAIAGAVVEPTTRRARVAGRKSRAQWRELDRELETNGDDDKLAPGAGSSRDEARL